MMICMFFREELISYYKQLSDAAELRATKARWRIRRHCLDEKRAELLQTASGWTSSADEVLSGFSQAFYVFKNECSHVLIFLNFY